MTHTMMNRLWWCTLALALASACEPPSSAGNAARARQPAFTTSDTPDDPASHDDTVLVVDFKDGTTKEQFDALEKGWGVDLELADEEEGKDSAITVARGVTGLDTLLARIRANPDVEAAEPLMKFQASFVPNDPSYAQQWNLKMIGLERAWEVSRGKGVIVAVLDTGIAFEDHDDFAQVEDLDGVNFVPGYDFVNNTTHPNDDHGHGTHVAGTIAQATHNGVGVAGVAFEASLMPVKVLDHFGSGNSAAIADAIRWSVDHGARVLNLSLGGGGRSQVLENAVEYARKKGAVVVCAAGNTGRGVVEFPAAYPGSVAVGAVGPSGQKAPYSSFGKELDIAAPGGDKSQGEANGILQNTIDAQDVGKSIYASFQGTSMATPHVAGVAALLFAHGASGPDEVEEALFASAQPAAGQNGWSEEFGYGILNADTALSALDALHAKAGGAARGMNEAESRAHERATPRGWTPLVGGLLALAGTLLTLRSRQRPGFLNVLLQPAFLIPFVLSTAGAFFVQWLSSNTPSVNDLVLPLPDWWQRWLFGRGRTVSPIVYSALLPILVSAFAVKWKELRPVAGGLALGHAGLFLYAAWAGSPPLTYLPFHFMAVPWLVINALVCALLARALIRRERA